MRGIRRRGERLPSPHTVHPRTCGEYYCWTVAPFIGYGSSPHMRGIRRSAKTSELSERFIPAHAENTPPRSSTAPPTPVHPRTCGEYVRIEGGIGRKVGSSPHMRGILKPPNDPSLKRRFIPAHAGNTSMCPSRTVPHSVHPRTCGEYVCRTGWRQPQSGSSPHMRGILLDSLVGQITEPVYDGPRNLDKKQGGS